VVLNTQKISKYLAQLKATLYAHYSSPQQPTFKTLRNGFIYFAVGLLAIYIANTNIPPSLQQELLTLAGLVACGAGFLIAMTAYIRLVISRFVLFFSKK